MKIVVKALVRWFWILLICIVVGYYGGKALAAFLPPQYLATSVIQLNALSRTSSLIQPVGAYSALVTSDSVLGQALKSFPTLNRQTVGSKQLVVTADIPSSSILIAVTLPDAKMAAGLANALAKLLVQQQNAYIQSEYVKEIQILTGHISDEQKTIDNLNTQIIKTPVTNATTIQQLQGQVSQHQSLQTRDITERQSLLTQQALFSSPLGIVQAATAPNKPSSLIGTIPLAPLALLLLVIAGGVIIWYLEQRSGRINGIFAVQQKISLPILGALRWTIPGPRNLSVRSIMDAKTRYAEDCRIMMADILFHAEAANARVLAITGTRLQAGTTSIASQLAALIAQSKRRVLLIDANLYEPALHKRLEVSNEAGLSKMLEEARTVRVGIATAVGSSSTTEAMGSLPVDSYIMSTNIPDLYVLPAGKPKVNPSSLLSMPEMGQFLKWASRRGDFVVIDCPALVYAEAHVLGSLSDQTFLVVDATRDPMKKVMNRKDELTSTGVKLSGLIVNKLGRWF